MVKVNNFDLVCSTKCMGKLDVEKYKSSETGLTVVIAHVPGPLVSGYFALATEAFDDDGLPHTLEHLIFLGSEDYPYKGVLDLLANRNLASGTNAWTETDHTCYTLTTAGSEGFLNLLPVYVDHILYPTLSGSGYVTEVHHVNGQGEDAGVVYCEMQGKENTGESLVHLEMTRAGYPGKCGYKSETGGLMKNLRESTNIAKVRKYHQDFYRPENLTLIITGQVDTKQVLDVVSKYEEKIIKKGNRPAFERPWQSIPPPVTKSVDIVVPYSCDEEEHGMVSVAWRGPSAVDEAYKMHALAIILRYLSDTAASPLQQEFVQTEDPLASSVDHNLLENSSTLIYLSFRNVPIAKLDQVKPRLVKKLKELRTSEQFDMPRLNAIIKKQKLELLLNMETKPHSLIAFICIGDMLFGKTSGDLIERLNPLVYLDKMEKEDLSFWTGLLDKYIIDNFSITVQGKPSIAECERIENEEKLRIEKHVKELGENGLKEKLKILENAMATNDIAPPASMLAAVPVPDPAKITFHKVESFSTNLPPPVEKIEQFPLYLHFDDIETNFVYLMVLMDTSSIPQNLRMYLPLFLDAVLESPILRDGKIINHLDVINELEKDTIAASTRIGIGSCGYYSCGPFSQAISLTIQVDVAKYERGINWLNEILMSTQFPTDRLSITAAKMVNEVAEIRRMGPKLVKDISDLLNYQKGNNNIFCNNAIRQHKFLSEIGKELCNGNETLIENLEKLRMILTDPKNMAVRIAANLDSLKANVADIVGPWNKLLRKDVEPSKNPLKIVPDCQLLCESSDRKSIICGIGSVESAYLSQTVESISDHNHPDLPALLVFMNYLTQLEGPMWKQIRGQGLSYGFHMNQKTVSGLLTIGLYRATSVVAAYNKAQEIVDLHLKPETEFDPILLVAAKSMTVFNIICEEDTVSSLVQQNILSYFKGTDRSYNREFVKKLAAVTPEDMKRVGQKHVAKLFDPKQVRLSLVCNTSKAEDLCQHFKSLGFNVTASTSLTDVFLGAQLKV